MTLISQEDHLTAGAWAALLEQTKCTEITVVCVRMVKTLFPINH